MGHAQNHFCTLYNHIHDHEYYYTYGDVAMETFRLLNANIVHVND